MTRVEFEGCFNFRDLGGLRTVDGATLAKGRLFRGDAVHLMTDRDARRARAELGLRTLVDLRSTAEIDAAGNGILVGNGLSRHHFPFGEGYLRATNVDRSVGETATVDRSPETMVANYLAIMEMSSRLVVGAVRVLAEAQALPAVFFCQAGKDRTGVLAATVCGAVGVRDEDIVQDYVASAPAIESIIRRMAQAPGAPAMYRELAPSHFAPVAETMTRLVSEVRARWGSFAGYLAAHGLDAAAIERLRVALVE